MPMYGNWMSAGLSVGTGAVVGVADQYLQNWDEKRARAAIAAGNKLSFWKEAGTYLNYGGPIAAVVATGLGYLKGDWATRALTAGGQLAGRKAVFHFTKATQATPWRPMRDNNPSPQPSIGGLTGSRLEF